MITISADTKRKLEVSRSDRFAQVLAVGFSAVEDGDLNLARSAADHVISRADSDSNDLKQGLALLLMIYDADGDAKGCDTVLRILCEGWF